MAVQPSRAAHTTVENILHNNIQSCYSRYLKNIYRMCMRIMATEKMFHYVSYPGWSDDVLQPSYVCPAVRNDTHVHLVAFIPCSSVSHFVKRELHA